MTDERATTDNEPGLMRTALALATTTPGIRPGIVDADELVPARLGRYLVLDRLGHGGMGVVYSAYDPQLDRKVAIKLLRRIAELGATAQQRLLREAQAMARLSHVNVVAVHDVGIVDDQLFIAMEFIKGQTLRGWMATRRSWRDVVTVFAQAGRGLAAAHASGVVHRDFKPDNVMVREDGRVVVMDFGIAAPELTSEAATATQPVHHESATTSLTLTGALLGTPAYMSPEQFTTARVDARSDQFSFYLAL